MNENNYNHQFLSNEQEDEEKASTLDDHFTPFGDKIHQSPKINKLKSDHFHRIHKHKNNQKQTIIKKKSYPSPVREQRIGDAFEDNQSLTNTNPFFHSQFGELSAELRSAFEEEKKNEEMKKYCQAIQHHNRHSSPLHTPTNTHPTHTNLKSKKLINKANIRRKQKLSTSMKKTSPSINPSTIGHTNYRVSKPEQMNPIIIAHITYNHISLKWNASNDNFSMIEKYEIQIAIQSKLEWKSIYYGLKEKYTVHGLQKGVCYLFHIRAKNGKGWGLWSNVTSATTHGSYDNDDDDGLSSIKDNLKKRVKKKYKSKTDAKKKKHEKELEAKSIALVAKFIEIENARKEQYQMDAYLAQKLEYDDVLHEVEEDELLKDIDIERQKLIMKQIENDKKKAKKNGSNNNDGGMIKKHKNRKQRRNAERIKYENEQNRISLQLKKKQKRFQNQRKKKRNQKKNNSFADQKYSQRINNVSRDVRVIEKQMKAPVIQYISQQQLKRPSKPSVIQRNVILHQLSKKSNVEEDHPRMTQRLPPPSSPPYTSESEAEFDDCSLNATPFGMPAGQSLNNKPNQSPIYQSSVHSLSFYATPCSQNDPRFEEWIAYHSKLLIKDKTLNAVSFPSSSKVNKVSNEIPFEYQYSDTESDSHSSESSLDLPPNYKQTPIGPPSDMNVNQARFSPPKTKPKVNHPRISPPKAKPMVNHSRLSPPKAKPMVNHSRLSPPKAKPMVKQLRISPPKRESALNMNVNDVQSVRRPPPMLESKISKNKEKQNKKPKTESEEALKNSCGPPPGLYNILNANLIQKSTESKVPFEYSCGPPPGFSNIVNKNLIQKSSENDGKIQSESMNKHQIFSGYKKLPINSIHSREKKACGPLTEENVQKHVIIERDAHKVQMQQKKAESMNDHRIVDELQIGDNAESAYDFIAMNYDIEDCSSTSQEVD